MTGLEWKCSVHSFLVQLGFLMSAMVSPAGPSQFEPVIPPLNCFHNLTTVYSITSAFADPVPAL